MSKLVAILTACLILCLGCSASIPHHFTVLADSRFQPSEQTDIVLALSEWQDATGVAFDYLEVEDTPKELAGSEIYLYRYDGSCPYGEDLRAHDAPERGLTCVGYEYEAVGGHVECLDIKTSGYGKRLVMHETGHVFGLVHAPNSVMATPVTAATDHLTKTDLDQFCALTQWCQE